MARSKGDTATVAWAQARARSMERRFESAWWLGDTRYGYVPQYADSLRDPDDEQVFQRHWIGVTPTESEVVRNGRTVPGIASRAHGVAALKLREQECYSGEFGLYHTGTGPTSDPAGNPGPTCDPWVSDRPSERSIFTLNTSIMAVGEGNYGRLGRTSSATTLRSAAFLALRAASGSRNRPSPAYAAHRQGFLDRSMCCSLGRVRGRLVGRAPAARRPARPRQRAARGHPAGPALRGQLVRRQHPARARLRGRPGHTERAPLHDQRPDPARRPAATRRHAALRRARRRCPAG